MKILIVEDNRELLNDIKQYLEKSGNICEIASDFKTADEKIGIFPYDILIIDLNLPDGNGLDIIREVKKENIDTGIIIISARNALDDKIKGLDLGADDYMTKPFFLPELNSRINALYRRKAYDGKIEIIFNEIKLLPEKHEVQINEQSIALTKKEYAILLYFISNKYRLVTKEAIAEHIWGDHVEVLDSFDFIYPHLANLRRKITSVGGKNYIKSIYSVGYKFTDEE
ncbi:MAG: response regulator transcription factor [Bacteroidetes bacterium]|nr:response regulator transcription factor [Bacteroidota bacterium]MCB0846398.1 response regulator transcription factor [Bacteroidota bacterium]